MGKRRGPDEEPEEPKGGRKPPPRPPTPPPAPPPAPEPQPELTESEAYAILSESAVRDLDLGESRADKPPEDLSESTAVVYMTESDVVKFDSDSDVMSGAAPPPPPPPPPPPRPPLQKPTPLPKPPAGAPIDTQKILTPRKGTPAKPPVPPRPPAPPAAEDRPSRWGPIALGIVLAILFSAVSGYTVHRMKEEEVERAREEQAGEIDRVREEAKVSEDRLQRAMEGRMAAVEGDLKRARDDAAAARRATDELERGHAADLQKVADDFRAAESTLKESLTAEREAEIKAAEKRERERGERQRLDLERRARETIDRFQALLDEAENRFAAEQEVVRREARAEILRREALLRKSFEEEKLELEAEKVKAIELETQKLEERLREEFGEERGAGGGGFLRDPDSGGFDEGGIDLEAEVWEHLKGHLGGSAEYRLFAHFDESDQYALAEQRRHEGIFRLKYDLKFLEYFELLLVPRVRVDNSDLAKDAQETLEERSVKRPGFTFEEAWLAGSFGDVDVRAGKQIYSWGTGDLLNPTDQLNPVDFTDLLDSEKVGIPAVDLSYYIGETTRIWLIGIPTFTPSRLPPRFERFDPFPQDPFFPLADRLFPDRTTRNASGAARVSTTLGGFDIAGTYYYGFNDLPTLTIDPSPAPPLPFLLTPRFDRVHMAGADVSTTAGDLEVHGEAAQYLVEGTRDDEYLQYVTGINYTIGDLMVARDEVRLILEYAGEVVTNDADDPLAISASSFARAFASAFLSRVSWKPGIPYLEKLELQATTAWLLKGPDSVFIRPEASYEIGAHTRLKIGFDLLNGSKQSFFGQFEDEDRFWMSFKLSF